MNAGAAPHPPARRPRRSIPCATVPSSFGGSARRRPCSATSSTVALPWVVLQLTGSAVAMGTVAMCAGIPRAALMLMGGAVTDRVSARKVLLATASARAVLVAAIGVLLWLHQLQLWHLFVLASAFGVADAFAMPSAGPLMRSLVPPEQLPAANSIWQSSALLTGIVGPAPAGMIMKALGAAWAFFLTPPAFSSSSLRFGSCPIRRWRLPSVRKT